MVPAHLEGRIDSARIARAQGAFAKENHPSDARQESEELQQIRNELRDEIAEKSKDVVAGNARECMNTALNMIEDKGVKAMVLKALADTAQNRNGGQSEFFVAASSSSHKYHPATSAIRVASHCTACATSSWPTTSALSTASPAWSPLDKVEIAPPSAAA
jgi:hypothetical protein